MQKLLTNRSILPEVLQPILPQLDSYYSTCLLTSLPHKAESVAVTLYLQPENLKLEIVRKAEELATDRLKIAASEWLVEYIELLVPLVLIPMTLAGVGLDCTPGNLSLVIEDSRPKAIWPENSVSSIRYHRSGAPKIPTTFTLSTAASLQELHQFVFRALFKQHLTPLFEQLTTLTGISSKLLWGVAGRSIFNLYKSLQQDLQCPAIQEDLAALLERETNFAIAEGKNPLYRETYFNQTTPNWAQPNYCLQNRLPSGFSCGDCPLLKPEEKKERWRTLYARNF